MSRIEQLINEIEEFIDGCKYQPLSNTKILVNKEEMEELLVELRLRVPEEIKKYQKIISQQDAILQDARTQAENMIADATAQTNQMVNDHEIVQRAYQREQEILEEARNQGQAIVDQAAQEADSIRENAIQYTDNLLANVQSILSNGVNDTRDKYEAMFDGLKQMFDLCNDSRASLRQSPNGQDGQEAYQQQDGQDVQQGEAAPQDTGTNGGQQ